MKYCFICYPKCSTCAKARDFLNAKKVDFAERNIATGHPTEAELAKWIKLSSLPMKRFFNTSGMRYRDERLSERLPGMSEAEQLKLLASDGMLVKRPLLIGEDGSVRVGFKLPEWENL